MFCALNGATDSPRCRSHAQIAVAIQLLPAFDEVPPMKSDRAVIGGRRRTERSGRSSSSTITMHHAS